MIMGESEHSGGRTQILFNMFLIGCRLLRRAEMGDLAIVESGRDEAITTGRVIHYPLIN